MNWKLCGMIMHKLKLAYTKYEVICWKHVEVISIFMDGIFFFKGSPCMILATILAYLILTLLVLHPWGLHGGVSGDPPSSSVLLMGCFWPPTQLWAQQQWGQRHCLAFAFVSAACHPPGHKPDPSCAGSCSVHLLLNTDHVMAISEHSQNIKCYINFI